MLFYPGTRTAERIGHKPAVIDPPGLPARDHAGSFQYRQMLSDRRR